MIQVSTYIMWHYWAEAVITSAESTFILKAFVSSEVHLTEEQKVPPASGCSCGGPILLWSIPRVPLWVVQQASQAVRLSQTCFLLTFVFVCGPQGMRSSWTKFASPSLYLPSCRLQLFWVTHWGKCLRHVDVNMDVCTGESARALSTS